MGPFSSIIHINEVQVQGCQLVTPQAAFSSTTVYLHQLRVMTEAYELPMSEQSLETAHLEGFALEHLKKELFKFIDPRWENGPFVLSRLDLRWPNIIVDDDLNNLAVIDWEWTGSIPRQLFTPPSWDYLCLTKRQRLPVSWLKG